MKHLLAALIEHVKENTSAVEAMRKALIDPGGDLDRLGKTMRDNLATHRSEMLRNWGKTNEAINKIGMRLGLVEAEGSEPAVKAELPFTCLVVDDDPEARRLIRRVLEDSAIAVLESGDGEDALSLLRGESPIDVVLTDIAMPCNGKKLAHHVLHEHQGVELILISGYAASEASDALAAGAYTFLPKPWPSNEALVESVISAAEHRRRRAKERGTPSRRT